MPPVNVVMNVWKKLKKTAATTAPLMLPTPPTMMTISPLMMTVWPMSGSICTSGAMTAPPAPAKAALIPIAISAKRLMLIP